MHLIQARNVNEALFQGLTWLQSDGVRCASRNGWVLRSPVPVCTVYQQPRERILWAHLRDANPFFHFLESLWMLAGSNQVSFPAHYAKQIQAYSDDGETLLGAYGHRWRQHFGYDQLDLIVHEVKRDPSTRRCVLSMWDGHSDLQASVHGYQGSVVKDVPCNTEVYFDVLDGVLNMTVCNRSNDIVWGTYGANAVHFSILLEYMACRMGLQPGVYYQMSNNFHLYLERPDVSRLLNAEGLHLPHFQQTDLYLQLPDLYPEPLFTPANDIDQQILQFFDAWHLGLWWNQDYVLQALSDQTYSHPALLRVAIPMVYAHHLYKQAKLPEALEFVKKYLTVGDWQQACLDWLHRRSLSSPHAASLASSLLSGLTH
ncbi:MAG: thymidylate synthase [Gammaproteobacteria bacterium]|nr:thymidylate synthase [Gammaproteobacteria bacterium]